MKARVLVPLNIRTGRPEILPDNNTGNRYYAEGDVIEIEKLVIGDTYKDNNAWYKLSDGGFVWSGGVEKISVNELSREKQFEFKEEKLLWPIKKFQINNIWPFSLGEGITVAILDTGIDISHPELKNSILDGYNFFEKSNDYMDFDGHGTRCAGIIAASGLFDVVGVSPKCKLLIAKIKNSQSSGVNENTLINALEWAIGKADIISFSGGKPEDLPGIKDAIDKVEKNNIVIVSAIGNQNSANTNQGDYPAKYNNVISVGSVNENLNLSPFTIRYDQLTIVAPGENIKTTDLNKAYSISSGTSMATPFVAGLIALYKSVHKNIEPSQIKQKLIQACDKKTDLSYNYNLINPKKFML